MSNSGQRWSKGAVAVILLLGLAARVDWCLRQPSDPASLGLLPDQTEYLQLGAHLAHGQGLWLADPRFRQTVYAYRMPGYPALVALCRAKPAAIRLVQAGLDASTILAVYLLGRRWLGERGGLMAAALAAVNPYQIFFCGLILSETLFTAMLIWGMALLVLSGGPWPRGWGRTTAWLVGAALLALGVLVRPGSLLLPLLLGWAGAIANRDRARAYQSRWPLPVGAVMVGLTAIALFPWAARNTDVTGAWIWTTTNEGITRYDGFNPDATGASDQRFVSAMPWTRDMTEVERSQYFARLADDWMADHPVQSIELAVVKMARTWSPVPLSQRFGSRMVYVIVGLCFSLLLDLLAIGGLLSGRLAWPVKILLVLPALYFTVASALSVGSLRYLVPAEPPMTILAAAALFPRRPVPAASPADRA